MKTNLNIQALHKSPKDKTLLIQSSNNESHINVPQMIEWKNITLPDQWLTTNENYKHNQQQSSIQDIQQYTDGSVCIKFNRSQSSRHSTSSVPTDVETEDEIFNTPLFRKNSQIYLGQTPQSKLKGIDNSTTSQISKPVYSTHTQLHEDDEASQNSPTQTDFEVTQPINTQLMTIKKEFNHDLEKLLIDFRSPENRTKRHAYQAKYDSAQQSRITRKWYDFMVEYGFELSFFQYMDKF